MKAVPKQPTRQDLRNDLRNDLPAREAPTSKAMMPQRKENTLAARTVVAAAASGAKTFKAAAAAASSKKANNWSYLPPQPGPNPHTCKRKADASQGLSFASHPAAALTPSRGSA